MSRRLSRSYKRRIRRRLLMATALLILAVLISWAFIDWYEDYKAPVQAVVPDVEPSN